MLCYHLKLNELLINIKVLILLLMIDDLPGRAKTTVGMTRRGGSRIQPLKGVSHEISRPFPKTGFCKFCLKRTTLGGFHIQPVYFYRFLVVKKSEQQFLFGQNLLKADWGYIVSQ